jgi:phosphoribosylformylglycinamidine synthase
VTAGDALVVDGSFEIPLAELRSAWSATLPAAFGG